MSTPVTLEERVALIEGTLSTINRDVATIRDELNSDVRDIKQDIKDLRESLARRPSWAVCTIIAGLGSVATALGATLLTMLVQAT